MIKVDLESYDNSWYKPARRWKKILWYITNLLFFKNAIPYPYPFKKWVLKAFGCKIGRNLVIKPNVSIKYPWLLTIKDNVWIGEHVWIDNLAMVSIASNVCISQGAILLGGNHDYTKNSFDLLLDPIILEEGVWISAKAIVGPGVKCYSHAILGLGAVATKDLEAYTIYLGNPAKKIRKRELYDLPCIWEKI